MARKRRSTAPRVDRLSDQRSQPLDFNDGDAPAGRAGDARAAEEVRREFPPERVRLAGMSGGESPRGEVTADDLSPETLLDEEPSHSPAARSARAATDSRLRNVPEPGAGKGHGRDEAERARDDAAEDG